MKIHLGGLILASLLLANLGLAQPAPRYSSKRLDRPRGTLNQPFDDSIFLGLFGQMGGGLKYDNGTLGYGGMVVFRPGIAATYLSFLHDWNASLVLQADYLRVSDSNRIFSGDIIIRPYFHDMRDPKTRVSPFFGVGLGGSEVELPAEADDKFQKGMSLLVEIGQEWTHKGKYLLQVKGQYRRYKNGGYDFSTWSLQAGAGIPLPW